ncbi:hypothetical protein BIY26_09545 [Brenneria goodwinii]|uniref:Uncharacterized protein n=1 Tax=Brenneria goodwinii TaxID=1109412 RepID=A0A250BKV5_9GAMM|nr:hypothetical protein [Brenneria goodwinii]ATA22630.1 hypothetical protein AWC36_00030 [Brenneria goodwinii]ATA23544.1 hypothetical protein AWC36_05170 [Brenneria goodwinii]ATA26819.1 hypothetical protein AWC36_23440 [Brenneria goodwinii]RLM25252.1 hypothetical protein BIY26_09545 [Brenneria goodwinii]
MLYSPFSEEMADLLSRDRVTAAVAGKIHFKSGTTYAHTGTGQLTLGGEVYYGVGMFGSIDDVKEEHTTSPTQLKLTLTGLDTSLIAKTMNESCVGRNAELYIVALSDEGVPLGYELIFKGRISSTGINAGDNNTVQYTASNVFEDWQRPFPGRFTDESHQSAYPGDRIFRYVAQMAERSIYWGSKKDAPGFTYQ